MHWMTFTVNLSSINSCALNDISSQCELIKLFIHCIFEYWMLLYSYSFLWIASDEYMFLKRWLPQLSYLWLKYLAGNTKKSLDCNIWCRDRYSNVCLNWGKHLYLRSSIEEKFWKTFIFAFQYWRGSLLWSIVGWLQRARRNDPMLAYCWVITDDVGPQLRQSLVFAGHAVQGGIKSTP